MTEFRKRIRSCDVESPVMMQTKCEQLNLCIKFGKPKPSQTALQETHRPAIIFIYSYNAFNGSAIKTAIMKLKHRKKWNEWASMPLAFQSSPSSSKRFLLMEKEGEGRAKDLFLCSD